MSVEENASPIPSIPELACADQDLTRQTELGLPLDRPWRFKGVVNRDSQIYTNVCGCGVPHARAYLPTAPTAGGPDERFLMRRYTYWGIALWPRTRRTDTVVYFVGQCPRCEKIDWFYLNDGQVGP